MSLKAGILILFTALTAGACVVGDEDLEGDYSWEQEIGQDESDETAQPAATVGWIYPVIFVPSNQTLTAKQRTKVETAFQKVANWYERELPQRKLRIARIRVFQGELTAAQYRNHQTLPDQLDAEYDEAWGYNSNTPGVAIVTMGLGFIGWAGGSGNGQRGYAIFGLDSLIRKSRCTGEFFCTTAMWKGTAAHEMGHMLTLPHNNHPQSIMQFHDNWWSRRLISQPGLAERAAVRNTIFLAPTQPGHKHYCDDNIQATRCAEERGDCDSDRDCRSGLSCRNNVGAHFGYGSGTDVCLGTGHAHFCSPSNPCAYGAGDCDSNADCVPGTYCQQDVGAQYGYSAITDVCVAFGGP